jgi:hypothetical protein
MTTRERNIQNLKIGTIRGNHFIHLNGKYYPLRANWKKVFANGIDKENWDNTWLLSPRVKLEYDQDSNALVANKALRFS